MTNKQVGQRSKIILMSGMLAIGILVASIVGILALESAAADKGSKKTGYVDGVFKVKAGGGSAAAPLTKFYPKVAEIKVGESVMWFNPTRVPEPHTVTFVFDSSYMPALAAPFVVSPNAGVSFTSAVPGANADPVTMEGPDGSNIVVAANARLFMPTAISSNGTSSYMPPNAIYTSGGDEKYINSGLIWPSGQSEEGLPPIDSFTVKFEKAGTYNYICGLHPWMTGQVVVK